MSTDGTIDWFCCSRFDAPSVFTALLDADKGGRFRIAADSNDPSGPPTGIGWSGRAVRTRFSVHALLGLGFTDEAAAFMRWPSDRVDDQPGDGSAQLKIMYPVHGSSDLAEETLCHFEGYQGSRPVRIGNGAADQLQLDIYREMLDSNWLDDSLGVNRENRIADSYGHLGLRDRGRS